jgi:hypothetical protein
MTDTLPNLNKIAPSESKSPVKSIVSDSRLPKVAARGDKKTSDSKLAKIERDKKKAEELRNQPKDFFKLAVNEYVELQSHENHLNNYYKRFLGAKMQKIATFSNTMRV